MIFNLVDFVKAATDAGIITVPTDQQKLLALARLLSKVRKHVIDEAVGVCCHEAELSHINYRTGPEPDKTSHYERFHMAERIGHKVRNLAYKDNSHDAVIEQLQKTEGSEGRPAEAQQTQGIG